MKVVETCGHESRQRLGILSVLEYFELFGMFDEGGQGPASANGILRQNFPAPGFLPIEVRGCMLVLLAPSRGDAGGAPHPSVPDPEMSRAPGH